MQRVGKEMARNREKEKGKREERVGNRDSLNYFTDDARDQGLGKRPGGPLSVSLGHILCIACSCALTRDHFFDVQCLKSMLFFIAETRQVSATPSSLRLR